MASAEVDKSELEKRWELFKDEIRSLYLCENLKLEGDNGVIDTMAQRYRFHAT